MSALKLMEHNWKRMKCLSFSIEDLNSLEVVIRYFVRDAEHILIMSSKTFKIA